MIELISDRFNKREAKRKVLSIGQHLFCRALSESKPKAQVEVSANDTWTLNENKSKTQFEFSEAGICRTFSESKPKAQVESGNQKIIRNKGNYSDPIRKTVANAT